MEDMNLDKWKTYLIQVSEATEPSVDCISTGSIVVDMITYAGGFPRGRVSEVWGPEGGGKSTLMIASSSKLSKDGGKTLYIDMEHKIVPEYFRQVVVSSGGDPEHVVLAKPPSGKDALLLIYDAIDEVDLIVLDSLPAVVASAELDADSPEDQVWAATARLISMNIKRIVPTLGLSKTALVGINQIRANMSGYGDFNRPGGYAWRHSQSLSLRVSRVTPNIVDKDTGELIGITSRVKVRKNAVGNPYSEVDIQLIWGMGVDPAKDAFEAALIKGVIEQSASWYSWKDHKWQGKNKAIRHIREELVEELMEEL